MLLLLIEKQWTDNGELCSSKCEKDGQDYNWCYKVGGPWDYCTPNSEKILALDEGTTVHQCVF